MKAVQAFRATIFTEAERFDVHIVPTEEAPNGFDAIVIGSDGTMDVHRSSVREVAALSQALAFVARKLSTRNC